jgi:hypothetical protein
MIKPTAYAFLCGAQVTTDNNDIHHEGGVYHVSAYDNIDKKYIKARCFHTLSDAWSTFKRYNRISAI